MDFEWVAIALGDVVWLSIAFVLGLLARFIGLPPLVGFLAAGFLLNAQGFTGGDMLQKLSDLGITLLLFVVGLKLNLPTLARPQVWAVTCLHTSIVVLFFGSAIYLLALADTPFLAGMDLFQALLVGFALSFSSTVFVAKVLEEKSEMTSLHGRIAIGVLIVQDIAAVVFLAVTTGKWPSLWALSVLLLFPLRRLLTLLLERVGHGELLVLYGFMLALGGAEAFELVGLKGDLGALVLGVLIADHPKAEEMAKTMLGFKDLFLLGFFLSIGLSGVPTWETLAVGAILTHLIFLKSALFFTLFTAFKLRARTSLLATLSLTNYSEFGLIVAAISVSKGWIAAEWLIVLAIALSLSFAISAALDTISHNLYTRRRETWKRLQRSERLPDDRLFDVEGAKIAVIGMGGVGTGTYDMMHKLHGDTVVGFDIDPVRVEEQQETGRNVLHGDPSDADFWDRIQATHSIEVVMLALPKYRISLAVLDQLKATSFSGTIAATARFQDEVDALKEAGATTVFNAYTEAGAGFASHVAAELEKQSGES